MVAEYCFLFPQRFSFSCFKVRVCLPLRENTPVLSLPFSQLLLNSSPDSINIITCPCCHHPPRQGQKSQDTRIISRVKTQGLVALIPDPFSYATRGSLTDRTQLHVPLAREWSHAQLLSLLSSRPPHPHKHLSTARPHLNPDLHLLQPPSPSPPALSQQLRSRKPIQRPRGQQPRLETLGYHRLWG